MRVIVCGEVIKYQSIKSMPVSRRYLRVTLKMTYFERDVTENQTSKTHSDKFKIEPDST